jgi:hypothetical protein
LYELHLSGSATDYGNSLPRASNIGFDTIPPTTPIPSPTPVLRISLPMSQNQAANVILNVAEEAEKLLTANPRLSEEALLDGLRDPDYLSLILEDPLLSVGKQIGLVGELLFLKNLIDRADATGISRTKAFSAWKNGSRDFSNNNVVVEVKTSGGKTRKHAISEITQLEIRGTETELYVLSASAAPDSSGLRRLPDHVQDLLNILTSSEKTTLLNRLRTWWRGGGGYDHGTRGSYVGEPPLSIIFQPALFAITPPSTPRVEPLVRASLAHGPGHAEDIQYKLNLEPLNPLPPADFDAVLDKLLA